MPLIKNRNPNIHIWKNIETSQELLAMLHNNPHHKNKIAQFKSSERIKQYLTNRILIQNIIGDFTLKKGTNNKPYLENSTLEISFSHNKDFTILMTNKIPCGVDIQFPTEKAVRVKSKFINDKDFCYKNNDFETLSKVWSCKEAAFKKFGNHEIFLKSNISVIQQLPNNIFEVVVEFKTETHTILLKQENIENNYLFFTIN